MPAVRIALDAMGGDLAPAATVQAARTVLAQEPPGSLEVLLVGDPEQLERELAGERPLGMKVWPAGGAVPEGAPPAAYLRQHPRAAVREAARLAAQGQADAVVSVGNTGALLVAAVWEMGLWPGVERPAAGAVFPFAPRTVLLDVGLNADVSPGELVTFARLGQAYARTVFGVPEPRVALLSNGREAGKGNRLVKAAYPVLQAALGAAFMGNVEALDLASPPVEVVVTDGFTGNVVLKTVEALGRVLRRTWQAGGRELSWDWLEDATQGEFPIALLGVRGLAVPGHGRSQASAIAHLLRRTAQLARTGFAQAVGQDVAAHTVPPSR